MSELAELNQAIVALNNLWPLLEEDEQDAILQQRNSLNDKAAELAHKRLREGVPELNDAIGQLHATIEAAKAAKAAVDDVAARVVKVADTIDKATGAVAKVAKVIAVL